MAEGRTSILPSSHDSAGTSTTPIVRASDSGVRYSAAVERVPVLVVGAGQAGLAVSRELTERGIEHVVLERGRVAETWRRRWDSFCLVTPNWTVQLPGWDYAGAEPDGYMPREELVAFIEGYAKAIGAPVRGGVDVLGIDRSDAGFVVRTSDGDVMTDRVVLATGAYQRPHRPPGAAGVPPSVVCLDADDYANPSALPDGRVIIVGSGQTGCQLAEELRASGREVVLSCGRAPWVTRRYGDRDMVWWGVRAGWMDQSLEDLPDPAARLWSNPLTSGHDGGHDLHLRTLKSAGVTLAGRFLGASERAVRFAPDLAASVAWGDERYLMFRKVVIDTARREGLEVPEIADPEPFADASPVEEVDLAGVGAVLFAGGFRPDYRSWLPWTDAFDTDGFPIQHEGASTVVPGLFFLGVPFLRTRKSSLLYGVGEDAAIVADAVAAR
jgi:putative flavoprotein involved in K+ transport